MQIIGSSLSVLFSPLSPTWTSPVSDSRFWHWQTRCPPGLKVKRPSKRQCQDIGESRYKSRTNNDEPGIGRRGDGWTAAREQTFTDRCQIRELRLSHVLLTTSRPPI